MTTENEKKQTPEAKVEAPKTEQAPQAAAAPPTPEPAKIRIFVYDGREFQDPDPKMSTEEIRAYYTTFFPELANAEILPPVARGNDQVIELKRKVGVKGRK
jgi:PRTRC genetic system protein C